MLGGRFEKNKLKKKSIQLVKKSIKQEASIWQNKNWLKSFHLYIYIA